VLIRKSEVVLERALSLKGMEAQALKEFLFLKYLKEVSLSRFWFYLVVYFLIRLPAQNAS
jgi:hypothetical protein